MKSRATFMVSRLLKLLDRQILEVRTENICGSGNPSWVESEIKPRRVGQNLCRKQLASTFLDPKIAKESISVIESCHRSCADALQAHFLKISISNRQQPDHACMNFCLSHSENSVQMHACMICRSEFSPEWLNQRMHGHRPARIRSGGCMTGNRKIMQK